MDIDEIRSAVRATVAAIAPESDLPSIRPDRPLRQQIELDSLDWLNLMAGLHERLRVDIPPAEQGRLTTIDALVAYLASRLTQPPAQALRATADAPLELPRVHRLADGTEVTVRAMRAQDASLEADFVRRLSDDSRYQRFMTTLRELPEAKLKYLTDVDGVHHVALVATAQRHGQEILLGVARYIVDAAGTGCEFAVALDDAWQGSGVAGILMHTLIGTARAQGLTRMEAIVLATNRRMLQFARQLGFTLRHDPDDRETVRAVRSLARNETG